MMIHWLSNNLWSPKYVKTGGMQYGLSEKLKAREAYCKASGDEVNEREQWVKRKFLFLVASPGGLATYLNSSTAGKEIKCSEIQVDKSFNDLL